MGRAGKMLSLMWGQTEPNCLVIGLFTFWNSLTLRLYLNDNPKNKKQQQQSLRFGLTPVIGEMIGLDSVKDYEIMVMLIHHCWHDPIADIDAR
jgi:hypothetical protein